VSNLAYILRKKTIKKRKRGIKLGKILQISMSNRGNQMCMWRIPE
jgi:hypothetical protein